MDVPPSPTIKGTFRRGNEKIMAKPTQEKFLRREKRLDKVKKSP
jgi:hypothetical protein